MANPTDSRTLGDVAATTVDVYLPGVVDNFFKSNAFWLRLATKERVIIGGGEKIRQSIIYDKLVGGSYSGNDTFDITRQPTKTVLIFPWAQYYVNITIDGLTMLQNEGSATKVIDLVESEMDTAKLSIAEYLGTDLFLDGTSNSSKALLGLIAAVDDGTNVTTYGGVTRDTTVQGTAVKGNLNTTGGALNLSLMNTVMGAATIQPARPDLVLVPQAMWDKFFDRVQPQQRYPVGPGFDDLVQAGMRAIDFNGAAVVVDSHVASGNGWFLNTDYMKLVVHQTRDFSFTGFKEPAGSDTFVGQILFAGQLVCPAPRLHSRATGLT